MKTWTALSIFITIFLSTCSATPTTTDQQAITALDPAPEVCATNAECIQKGLPLLRPPTRTRGRRADDQATSPGIDPYRYPFVISINKISDGSLMGYLQPENGESAIWRLGSKADADIFLTAVAPGDSSTSPISFKILTPLLSGFDWLGFNMGNYLGDGDVDPAGANYGTLANANEATSPGQTCQPIDQFNGAISEENPCVETAIWEYESSTGELAAAWNNKDSATYGSTVQLDWLFSSFGALYFTGNAVAFSEDNSGNTWEPVFLRLEYL